MVGGREAVHAGPDDDEAGRCGYHCLLPPRQWHVKITREENIMARTGQPAVRHVAAVERAFTVLDALADGGELGTNEIARRTGINASTVSRLLATLASARFVEHVPETGRYRLSLRLIELGNAVLGRLDLRTSPIRICRRSSARRARRRRSPPLASTTRSPSTSRTAPRSCRALRSSAGRVSVMRRPSAR